MRELSVGDVPALSSLPDAVWSRIASSPRRLLILDYDGTLAPFNVDRGHALPARRTRAALEALIVGGESVVVVSGRPIAELHELLGGLPMRLIGEHGWEERDPDGQHRLHPVPEVTAARLGLAYRAASACGWGPYLEQKRASIVLHTRGVSADQTRIVESHCRQLWKDFFERGDLRLEELDGGVELRASTHGKGTVVWELLEHEPSGTLPVYLGDDRADEQAFQVLRPFGVTIRVGRTNLPTAAEWRLGSTEEVTAFLERWHDLLPDGGTGPGARG